MIDAPHCPATTPEPSQRLSARPRLMICDDHRLIVEMLVASVIPSYEVVATAFDGEEILGLVRQRAADCLLLDLFLPRHNGLELIPRVREIQPALKILVLTMALDRPTAAAAFAAGANGFVPKDADTDELRRAIREVVAGRRYLSPRVPKNTRRIGLHTLYPALCNPTPRQHRILIRMGDGESESAIARELGVTPACITLHKRNLMRALGLEPGASLREFAFRIRVAIDAGSPRNLRWRAPVDPAALALPMGRPGDDAEPSGP
jgi:DNA-binding NarL/FixJ family response regulator